MFKSTYIPMGYCFEKKDNPVKKRLIKLVSIVYKKSIPLLKKLKNIKYTGLNPIKCKSC